MYVQRNEHAKITKSMAWYSFDIHHSMQADPTLMSKAAFATGLVDNNTSAASVFRL